MLKFIGTAVLSLGLTTGLVGASFAAPVPGNPLYVTLYDAVFANCTWPDGSLSACETAINAYSAALVANVGTVSEEEALTSFIALRAEIYAANTLTADQFDEVPQQFRADIDALFELLLPESGAIPVAASGTV